MCCSFHKRHQEDLVTFATWEIGVVTVTSNCCHAHHSPCASCKGWFARSCDSKVLSICFCFLLWQALGSTKCTGREQSGCLD